MLRKVLKGLFLLALVFVAIWVVVIGYWRLTGTDPSGTDLALYLVGLPIAVIVVFLGAKALVKRRRNADTESDASSPDESVADKHARASSPEDHFYLCVLDTALRLPVGTTGEDALAVLAEGKTRPGLDDALVDDQGFPVFATRVADIVDDGLEQALGLPENYDETPIRWTAEQLRALAMGRDVLDDLLAGQLGDILAELAAAPVDTAPARGSMDNGDPSLPDLQIRLLLPQHWSVGHRDSATAWFREHAEQLALHTSQAVVAEQAKPSAASPGFGELNALAAAGHAEDRDTICVLLACNSMIGEAEIARLDGEGRLFSQANPRGIVPSEGAAGLVVVSKRLIADTPFADYAEVRRAATADRQTPADRKPRRGDDQTLLGRLASKALANAQCAAQDIAFMVSDAGINSDQTLEHAQLTGGEFDHLDPTADCPNIGTACGDLDTVGAVAALALSHSAVRTTGGPVLAISLSHPLQRAAVVLQPPPEPEPEPKSNDPQPGTAPA